MVYNTQAIVLQKHNYGDTSIICNVFTLTQGKINIIAKGARTIKNPHSAILQPLHCIDLVYYYKTTRNIQIMKEASIINNYTNINKVYNKMIYALTVIAIINKISLYDTNSCDIIYRLTTQTLKYIDMSKTTDSIKYYIFFQLQLLIYLGYQPIFFRCYKCEKKINSGYFNYIDGQLVCRLCSDSNKIVINSNGLKIIQKIMKTHIKEIEKTIVTNKKTLNNLNVLLYKFLTFHLPELRNDKLYSSTQYHG